VVHEKCHPRLKLLHHGAKDRLTTKAFSFFIDEKILQSVFQLDGTIKQLICFMPACRDAKWDIV
jgi:hypothetical protein